MKIKNKNKYILLMLFSAFTFSAMQIIVKILANIPLIEKVFFRNLISLILSIIIIKKQNLRYFGLRENRKFLFYRFLTGYIGIILFFYATSKMMAADAAILNKLSPVFITIIAHYFLKEKINKAHIITLAISIIGALLVIKPKFNYEIIPALIGLLSAVISGIAYIFITLIGQKESIYTIVFTFSLLSVMSSIPFMFFSFEVPTAKELLLLLLLGTLAAVGQIALTYGYNSCAASEVSIYDYSNIVFSSILGYFVLSEFPDIYSITGGLLIILASLFLFLYNNKTDKT